MFNFGIARVTYCDPYSHIMRGDAYVHMRDDDVYIMRVVDGVWVLWALR